MNFEEIKTTNATELEEFESTLIKVEKLNNVDYGGEHYLLHATIKTTDMFENWIIDNLESIDAIAKNQFDGTHVEYKENNLYLTNLFIDKSNDLENENKQNVLEDLFNESINAFIFAINGIKVEENENRNR